MVVEYDIDTQCIKISYKREEKQYEKTNTRTPILRYDGGRRKVREKQ